MSTQNDASLPNLVTIVGQGVQSSYEITVSGNIELVGADPLEKTTVVTEKAAEGAMDTGVVQFRFSGEMANIRVTDWNGVHAPESPSTPKVHINYGVPDQ